MNTLRESLQRYPLIIITLCYAAGIALSAFFFAVSYRGALITGTLLLSLALICWWLRFNGLLLFCIAICFLIIGAMHAGQRRSLSAGPLNGTPRAGEETEVVILGTILQIEAGSEEASKGVIDLHYYRTVSMQHFAGASGLLLISLRGNWPRTILPGDQVSVRGELRQPRTNNTPGVFNYSRYLARKNIYLQASIRSPLFIQPVRMVDKPDELSLQHRLERIRAKVAFQLSDLLPATEAGLYRALLIGDKSGLNNGILESFKGAGVMHILAISGMHMALLGFLLFQTVFWLIRRSTRVILMVNARKLSLLACLFPLLAYTLLAGAAPPVVRSFVMSVFVITALTVNRVKSALTLLSAAGLLILVLNPLALESASFQLSFAAVASIIMFSPVIFSRLQPGNDRRGSEKHFNSENIIRWLWGAVSITVSATLGTFPLLLYHFNRFSLVTIPANLVIEPLICLWALPFGFLALPFLATNPSLAAFLLQIGMAGLSLSVKTAAAFSSLRLSTLWLPDPSLLLITAYYISLLLLFLACQTARFIRPALVSMLVCLLLFLYPLTGLHELFRQENRVTFIDIGHGSASLIELAGGRNILLDGGGKTTPGFDTGERILAPFLWHRNIARLDDIIITHADADHYNGIVSLLPRFRPERIWLASLTAAKPGFKHLYLAAEKACIPLAVPEQGILLAEQGSRMTVLSSTRPEKSPGRLNDRYEDDNGLIVRLDTPSFSVVFPGDITKKMEEELVVRNVPLAADILLSPHHGSGTSNSAPFLSAVHPKFMVVSTADKTGTLFPTAVTLEHAAQQQIRVLTTSMDGSVTVTGTEEGYTVQGYQAATPQAREIEQRFYPVTPR